jgi:hypothetical protein
MTVSKKDQLVRRKDWMGWGLLVFMLCLLPLERWSFPFRLQVADFALVTLTLYGLAKAWRGQQRLNFPLLLPMWLILLSSLVATLMGFAYSESVVAIVQELYLFVWFLVLANLLWTFPLSDLDRLLKVWSVMACVQAAVALMGMMRIGPRIFYLPPYYTALDRAQVISSAGFMRAVGTFANSNAAGAYLSISFFVSLATGWPVWLRAALGTWLFAGILGTGSLGALASTGGGLVLLLVVYPITVNRQTAKLWGAIICIGASLLLATAFVFSFVPSLLSEFGFDTQGQLFALTVGRFPRSMASRLTRIEEFWSIYSLHPWGTGPDSSASFQLSLHNDYVAFLFERGPAGAIGWLWIVASTLLTPLRVAYQHPDRHRRWQVLVLGAGFAACAINALTHEVSHFRQVWVLMAFVFAVSGILRRDLVSAARGSWENANQTFAGRRAIAVP